MVASLHMAYFNIDPNVRSINTSCIQIGDLGPFLKATRAISQHQGIAMPAG